MSSQWYYMASGWFHRAKRVGPISDRDLLLRIDQGKLDPETLVQSPKTRNRWVPMRSVGPAMKRWRELNPDDETPRSEGKAG
ncbi:MAG: DUF4339 domain-containing protein [Planctomycetota bacterium]